MEAAEQRRQDLQVKAASYHCSVNLPGESPAASHEVQEACREQMEIVWQKAMWAMPMSFHHLQLPQQADFYGGPPCNDHSSEVDVAERKREEKRQDRPPSSLKPIGSPAMA